MESQKTNIKRAYLFDDGVKQKRDIFVVDGIIKTIRSEVRQSVFSGVYEMEADGLFAVPFFTDSGCFALGLRDQQVPKLSEQAYKRYGFFSFVTMLNPLDAPARLFEQKEFASAYRKDGMYAWFLSGGTRNKIYHLGENVYEDIISSEYCIGASALVDDAQHGIDTTRFANMIKQVKAAAFDTERACVIVAMMGDIAEDFGFIEASSVANAGTVIPAFVNRNKRLMKEALRYIKNGGTVVLVAGAEISKMDTGVIPLSQALVRIYEAQGNLNGVLAASYSGGVLPKKNSNCLEVRGDILNLSSELKETIGFGVPMDEVLKTVIDNPIAVFGLEVLKVEEERPAKFLLVDEGLSVRYIVDGHSIYPPESYKTPMLFI